ncbi:MAG: M28 family peptidase [Candidatus Hydrogenedentes bacterium]|nr:M28 family peptidase [Candidatus Hydrogenedentota bacterium]
MAKKSSVGDSFHLPAFAEGHTAMKVIVVGGVVAFILLFITAEVLNRTLKPSEAQRTEIRHAESPFNGERAYADLKRIVEIGPRPAGSEEAARTRDYIKRELTAAGLEVSEQAFDASTPIGVRKMVNLTGIVQGTKPGALAIGNHYDTKYFPEFRFVGANDGGSTTAWMIEFARTLGAKRAGRSVWLIFFDGEEAFKEWSDTDSLYGSREYVVKLREQHRLDEIKVMVNVDMIGDCYLGINRDGGAPDWLASIVWNVADRLGYGKHFLSMPQTVQDDHIPFRRAGVPALELIDFSYGGSVLEHQRNWHTPNDTIEKVCPASLQAVGDVVYHSLAELDTYFDDNGRR